MYKRIGFNDLFRKQVLKSKSLVLTRVLTSKFDMNIQTFVFLDTETTGLPSEEGNRTKITEICIVAVQADHINSEVYPRVLNKLSFCFNPLRTIAPICKDLTGLSNELLQSQSEFQKGTVETIKGFLALQKKPLCLVAHNGNTFDYPILRAEIYNAGGTLPEDILCIDSLLAFRQLDQRRECNEPRTEAPPEFCDGYDKLLFEISKEAETSDRQLNETQVVNETTPAKHVTSHLSKAINGSTINDVYCMPDAMAKNPSVNVNAGKSKANLKVGKSLFGRQSYKLLDVYARLTNKEPIASHEAECDCNMLIECAVKIGGSFVDWANTNARKFSDVPMMKPRRKLRR